MLLRFKIWLLDDKHAVLFYTFIFLLILSIVVGGFLFIKDATDTSGVAQAIEMKAKENNKHFSILDETKQKKNDDGIVLTYDLYMKEPFENANNVNTQLNAFIDSVKTKYNYDGNKVKAIGIRLYDRKIVWDMGLTPRGLAMYTQDPDKIVRDIDKNKDKTGQTITQADGKKVTINSDTTQSPNELAWTKSMNIPAKDINYDHYVTSTLNLKTYNPDSVGKTLSDQEFAFWLKMKEYEALIGNHNIDAAAQLYLSYDLNGQVGYQNFVTIAKDFEDFDKRQTDIGDSTSYYPNKVLLRQEAAVYRPQLLFYILSNGKMINSYTKAQKELIEIDPGNYSQVIKDHIKDVSKDVDKYGKINYYAKKDNDGKYVNVDPFSATTGKYAKDFPKIQRPMFSPVLSKNNALYSLSYINSIQ